MTAMLRNALFDFGVAAHSFGGPSDSLPALRDSRLPALYLRSSPDLDVSKVSPVLRSSKKRASARSHRCPALV